ncbi:hypothetical protein ACOSQ2_024966 [Xanthoceras sorbifolium]
MEKARKNVNVDRTVASEAGKENVDPVLDNKVVGVVTRIKVILGMLDGNVKEGAHVAVTVKADYSDNAVTEERRADTQKQKKWKRRAREKGENQTVVDGDMTIKKRSLEKEDEEAYG